jgi:hypothetical protein
MSDDSRDTRTQAEDLERGAAEDAADSPVGEAEKDASAVLPSVSGGRTMATSPRTESRC